MLVGSLRIADTYAGLFSESGETPTDRPELKLSESKLEFGTLYQGDKAEKTLNVKGKNLKGDITVSVTGNELTPSATTIAAADAESDAGADVVFTLNPQTEDGKATITLSTEGVADQTLEATWATAAVKDIATIKDFAAEKEDNFLAFRYTGEATVSYVDNSGETPVIYLQDKTGGATVQDEFEALKTSYKQGDKVKDFICVIANSLGTNYIIPLTETLGTTVSEGNAVDTVKVTLAELKAAPGEYVNRLVRIENATLTAAEGVTKFAEGMAQPTITDASGEGKLRIFKGTDLIGTEIPAEAVNITGLSTSASAVIVAPRALSDIAGAVAEEPSLTITPEKLDTIQGFVGKQATFQTIHVKAVNLPGEAIIDIAGTNRALFSSSVTTIPEGSSETDIIVTYSPDKVGKHAGRISIDCPQAPDLYTAINLSAYAIDEQNPPTITVEPAEVPQFTAKAGETQEQTITIKTAGLPDFGKLKLKTSGVFRINNTMLLKDFDNKLTITFAPKEAGDYENEIEVSALGVETFTIKISGKATDGDTPSSGKEGDELPLDTSSPLTLLNEPFNSVEKDKPVKLEGWKNLAMTGTRAWWGQVFADTDPSAGEKAAKVTPYDGNTAIGEEEPCQMMLVTPALDFKNSASKMFTFRVRGDYLRDEQNDKLELCYIDMADGDMYVQPVGDVVMPASKDVSGEWQEFHIDLTGQNLADVFFMGFRFTSQRGRENSATYYIDDVTYGRTDLPVIRPSLTSVAFTAQPNKDASSPEISVTTENLSEPVTLTLGGGNKSKFKLTATELPATGGAFSVLFNSDTEGVHQAYVKLSSRGAADVYIPLSVNNSAASGVAGVTDAKVSGIKVYDLSGRKVKEDHDTTQRKAVSGLPAGTYIIKVNTASGADVRKITVD